MISEGLKLGTDSWANDVRMTYRAGLRSQNVKDLGELRIWVIFNNVIVSDGDNANELPIPCDSESAAILEMQRIARELELGGNLPEILRVPASDIPARLLDARIS